MSRSIPLVAAVLPVLLLALLASACSKTADEPPLPRVAPAEKKAEPATKTPTAVVLPRAARVTQIS
jgi:hypothetical protein